MTSWVQMLTKANICSTLVFFYKTPNIHLKGTLPWKINVEIAAHADRDEEDNSNALYLAVLRWTKVEVFEVEDLSHHGNDDARIVSRLCVTPFVHTDSAQSSTLCALTTYNTEARNNSRVTIAMEMRNFFLFFCR